MAVLPDSSRLQLHRGLMRYWSRLAEEIGVTKADLRAAIDATDDWIDDNAGAYNTALPAAFRTSATAAQKTLLFCAVASLRVSKAFAVSLFGEVD